MPTNSKLYIKALASISAAILCAGGQAWATPELDEAPPGESTSGPAAIQSIKVAPQRSGALPPAAPARTLAPGRVLIPSPSIVPATTSTFAPVFQGAYPPAITTPTPPHLAPAGAAPYAAPPTKTVLRGLDSPSNSQIPTVENPASLSPPDSEGAGSQQLSTPLPSMTPAATLTPPELPERPPLSAPSYSVSLPTRKGSGKPVSPLAWRTKAYRLAQDFPGNKSGECKAWKVFAGPLDDTSKCLVSACNSVGFEIEAAADEAGQIAVRSNDPAQSKVQIVFALKAISPDQTAVMVGLFPETRAIKTQVLEDLLQRTDLLVSKKGLL